MGGKWGGADVGKGDVWAGGDKKEADEKDYKEDAQKMGRSGKTCEMALVGIS